MTLNLKDPVLAQALLKQISQKNLKVRPVKDEGRQRLYYQPHERMKVFFGSKKIGTVRSVSPDSTVELELTHPRGINMIMGPDKSKVRIGRK